jgi:hypothetical protein
MLALAGTGEQTLDRAFIVTWRNPAMTQLSRSNFRHLIVFKLAIAFLTSMVLLISLAGCGGADVAASNLNTKVRVIDAMATAGNATVNVNGDFTFFGNDIAYGAVNAYNPASNTQQIVTVLRSTNSDLLAQGTFQFNQNTKTTLFLSGQEGSSGNPPSIIAVADNTSNPSTGDFKIRVLHGSILAGGSVDIYVLTPSQNINAASPLSNSPSAYGAASAFVELAAGTPIVIKITPTGQKAPVLATFSVTPTNGDLDTVFLYDSGTSVAGSLLVGSN